MPEEVSFHIPEHLQDQELDREQNLDGQNGDDSNVVNIQLEALREAQTKRFNDDTEHRAGLVDWIKELIPTYLFFVLCLLIGVGFSGITHFHLSDEIILAILCTTTANITGLAVIVLKGLFK